MLLSLHATINEFNHAQSRPRHQSYRIAQGRAPQLSSLHSVNESERSAWENPARDRMDEHQETSGYLDHGTYDSLDAFRNY
jgi:hypothetical protein